VATRYSTVIAFMLSLMTKINTELLRLLA